MLDLRSSAIVRAGKMDGIPKPRLFRIVFGFVLAPLLASAVYALYDSTVSERFFGTVIFIAKIGAYPVTIVVALPIYFLLKGRVKPKLATICLIAGLTATLPWALITTSPRVLTPIFLSGVFGGVVFWLLAVCPLPKPKQQQISATHPPVPDDDRAV
jgi:hypothetical protein